MKDEPMTPDAAQVVIKGPHQEITRTPTNILRVDDLVMDLNAHAVTRGKVQIRLSRKEFALLGISDAKLRDGPYAGYDTCSMFGTLMPIPS